MKKNRLMRIASLLIIAVVISTCAISGTFAKYTSKTEGSDSARVAKWEFNLNNGAFATEEGKFTFDLFNTINDTVLGEGGAIVGETDVNDGLIAPGTQGSFVINLKNVSEVTANYEVKFYVTNANNIPVVFKVNNNGTEDANFASWTAGTDAAYTIDATTIGKTDGTAAITVSWQWPFEGNDVNDTTLGKAGSATIEVKAEITVTQVD